MPERSWASLVTAVLTALSSRTSSDWIIYVQPVIISEIGEPDPQSVAVVEQQIVCPHVESSSHPSVPTIGETLFLS
jgi:hypothetical protein